jgi:hypothetical protein
MKRNLQQNILLAQGRHYVLRGYTFEEFIKALDRDYNIAFISGPFKDKLERSYNLALELNQERRVRFNRVG